MMWEGINQRKFPRVAYKCHIRIFKDGREDDLNTITENIGVGGICVVLNKQLGLFDNVSLEVFLDDDSKVECGGTVVWVVKNHPKVESDETTYDIGVEFTDMPEGDKAKITQKVEEILASQS